MTKPQQKDGGPAYPTYWHPTAGFNREGMTLRDWFAGQVIGGMCAHPRGLSQVRDADLRVDAALAYRIADAMLAARSTVKEGE